MKYLVLIFGLLQIILCNAQNDEQSSLYMYNTQYYNPAYSGSRNTISASLVGRYQWAGFKGAPKTGWFSVSAPLKNRSFGIGGHFISDKIGARNRNSGYLDLSGSIKLNKRNDRLAAGISLGFDNIVLNYQDLYVIDQNDPLSSVMYNKTSLNTGVGLYTYGDRYYFGVSVPRVIKRRAKDAISEYGVVQQNLFINGGYVFKLNSVLDLKTSGLIKVTNGSPIVFDLNASLLAYKKFWIGGMYRLRESIGVNFSLLLYDKLTVAYAYDFPINRLIGYQSGTHEIALQLDLFKYKLGNSQISPRYF